MDGTRLGRGLVLTVAAALGLMLAGCQMLNTAALYDAGGRTCRTATGEYFLPKRNINVVVNKDPANFFKLTVNPGDTVADRSHAYCLDFYGSITSDDLVVIERKGGLLQSIRANAADQSTAIVDAIVDTAAVAVTGNPNEQAARSALLNQTDATELANYAFDPFNRYRLAQINEAISTYGFCLFVEDHTIVGPGGHAAVQQYCNRPVAYERSHPPLLPPLDAASEGLDDSSGILYRSNQARRIVVMRRRDPGAATRWELYITRVFEMPNEAPVFSVSVDRSFFVTRETNLAFSNGVLTDVTIKKPSEALVVADLTLKLAQTIVAIPAQIISVRVQAVNNRKALIDAQNQLIYNEIQYQNALAAKNKTGSGVIPVTSNLSGTNNLSGPEPGGAVDIAAFCSHPGMKALCSGPKFDRCRQQSASSDAEFRKCLSADGP
jgi:hypothetical protein